MTLEVQMMFHVMLLGVCLVCGAVVLSGEKDGGDRFKGTFIMGILFIFIPLEFIYWIGGWAIGYFFF
jgi:hypothetical protein